MYYFAKKLDFLNIDWAILSKPIFMNCLGILFYFKIVIHYLLAYLSPFSP